MRGKRKTPIVTISAAKGGVAKTTTVQALASILAKFYKRRVLVIEADMQSSICYQFGLRGDDHPAKGVVEFCSGAPFKECVSGLYSPTPKFPEEKTGEVWVMAASKVAEEMQLLDTKLANREKSVRFASRIDNVANKNFFDVILVDTPPSFHSLTDEAVSVSDGTVIPVVPNDAEGRFNLSLVIDKWRTLVKKSGRNTRIVGVIISRANLRTRNGKTSFENLKDVTSRLGIYMGLVNDDPRVPEAATLGVPIIDYAPYCRASIQYQKVAKKFDAWVSRYQKEYRNKVSSESVQQETKIAAAGGK